MSNKIDVMLSLVYESDDNSEIVSSRIRFMISKLSQFASDIA